MPSEARGGRAEQGADRKRMFGGSFGVECSFFWCKSVKCSFFWCKKVLVWVRLLQEGLSSLGRHEAAFSLTVGWEGARCISSLLKTPCRHFSAPMHPRSRAWLLLDLLKQRTGPSGPPWLSLNPPGPPAGAAGEHSGYLAAAFGARAVVSCSEQSPRSHPDPAQQPVAILRCPGSLTEE